jgi:hypothetical protein
MRRPNQWTLADHGLHLAEPNVRPPPLINGQCSPNGALWNIGPVAVSLRLDAGELDHLAPLLGFVDDKLAEVGRRSRQRRAAEVGETGLHLRSSRAALASLLSLLTISAGVAFGAPSPYQIPPRSPEPTSPLNGVVFDLRYSFFLFDQIVIAVTDSLSVLLKSGDCDIPSGARRRTWYRNQRNT